MAFSTITPTRAGDDGNRIVILVVPISGSAAPTIVVTDSNYQVHYVEITISELGGPLAIADYNSSDAGNFSTATNDDINFSSTADRFITGASGEAGGQFYFSLSSPTPPPPPVPAVPIRRCSPTSVLQ